MWIWRTDKAPPPNPTPSQPASMGRGLVVRSADQGADASPSINSVTSIVNRQQVRTVRNKRNCQRSHHIISHSGRCWCVMVDCWGSKEKIAFFSSWAQWWKNLPRLSPNLLIRKWRKRRKWSRTGRCWRPARWETERVCRWNRLARRWTASRGAACAHRRPEKRTCSRQREPETRSVPNLQTVSVSFVFITRYIYENYFITLFLLQRPIYCP